MDDSVDEYFSLNDFKYEFDPQAFIRQLTEHTFHQAEAMAADSKKDTFDLTPFEQLFKKSMYSLRQLREKANERIRAVSRETKDMEQQHKEKISQLQNSLNLVMSKFRRLDQRISKVSHTAVQIGHTLESVESEKARTIAARETIAQFLSFHQTANPTGSWGTTSPSNPDNDGHADDRQRDGLDSEDEEKVDVAPPSAALVSKLDPIFADLLGAPVPTPTAKKGRRSFLSNDGEDEKATESQKLHKAAKLIQSLQNISTELRTPGSEQTQALIAKTATAIETRLLERFEKASSQGNREAMKEYGETLFNFRGGHSVTQRFIFKALSKLDSAEEMVSQGIPVPDFVNKMNQFFKTLYTKCHAEAATIVAVFPNPGAVIRAMIDRIFNEKIQRFIDSALSQHRTTEDFLEMLDSAHYHTAVLVESLQKLIPKSAQTDNRESDASLKELMEQLFAKYKTHYLESELQLLQEFASSEIKKAFDQAAVHAANNFSGTSNPQARRGADEDKKGSKASSGFSIKGISGNIMGGGASAIQQHKTALRQVLSCNLIDKLLSQNSAAIKRADHLSERAIVAENVYQIFSAALTQIVDNYMMTALNSALDLLPEADPRSEPDPIFFLIVQLINSIAQKIDTHYHTVVVPALTHSLNTQTICESRKREALGKVENVVLKGLTVYLNSTMRYVEKLLAKQKSTEYKPRDDQTILDGDASQVISTVAKFVTDQYEVIVDTLAGKNLDRYLHVWGVRLHRMIVAHIKKLSITPTGALLLTRDVKELQEAVREFHIAAVDELFDRLRALINLLVVGVDNIQSLIVEDKKIATCDQSEIESFLKLRSDYSKARIMALLKIPERWKPDLPALPAAPDLKDIKTGIQDMRAGLQGGLQDIRSGLQGGLHDIRSGLSGGLHDIRSGIQGGLQDIRSGLQSVAHAAQNILPSLNSKQNDHR